MRWRFLLQSKGHSVTEAADGQLALDALGSGAQASARSILDLMMPVMDGATFLEHNS